MGLMNDGFGTRICGIKEVEVRIEQIKRSLFRADQWGNEGPDQPDQGE